MAHEHPSHKPQGAHVHKLDYCKGCDVVHCDLCQAEWHRQGGAQMVAYTGTVTPWPTATVTTWSYGKSVGEAKAEGC